MITSPEKNESSKNKKFKKKVQKKKLKKKEEVQISQMKSKRKIWKDFILRNKCVMSV